MIRHVSAEILARRKEGAVSTRKAARIDAHMSTCASCARTNSDLAAVSSLLAAVQLPTMPDSLAQRVQMAIADESAARAARSAALGTETRATSGTEATVDSGAADAAHDAGDAAARIPGRPDLPTRSKRHRATRRFRLPSLTSPLLLRGLAGAAAVAVIAGAGFLLANGQPHVQGSSTKASTGVEPKSVHSGAAPVSASPSRAVSLNYQLQGKQVTTTALVSKANFERSSLARLARSEVRKSANFTTAGTKSTPLAGNQPAAAATFDVTRLENCLSGINSGRTVLVATIARFLGKPATIIVFKSLQSADFFDIAIVGPACSASNPHLIFNTTIPAG